MMPVPLKGKKKDRYTVLWNRTAKRLYYSVPVAQWLEHCISSAKCCGFNSQGTHVLTKKKWITWMHCNSLWIKASAKCVNVNILQTEKNYHKLSKKLEFVAESGLHFWPDLWGNSPGFSHFLSSPSLLLPNCHITLATLSQPCPNVSAEEQQHIN